MPEEESYRLIIESASKPPEETMRSIGKIAASEGGRVTEEEGRYFNERYFSWTTAYEGGAEVRVVTRNHLLDFADSAGFSKAHITGAFNGLDRTPEGSEVSIYVVRRHDPKSYYQSRLIGLRAELIPEFLERIRAGTLKVIRVGLRTADCLDAFYNQALTSAGDEETQ